MSDPGEVRSSKAQAASSGRPQGRPKIMVPPLESGPHHLTRTVYLLDLVVVRDLAGEIGLKPFQVVADLMEMRLFKSADDTIDFDTASVIARKHGYNAEKPPPGVLVL